MTHLKAVSSLTALLLSVLFAAPFAFAEHGVEGELHVEGSGMVAPPPRPLDILKARALQGKNDPQKVQMGLNADMKLRLGNASSSGERGDGMKDRHASTTNPLKGIRALVAMHTGVIKNRFHVAITHFNKLLERIDSRLAKMTAEGIDTTSVDKLKVDAELAVDKAEVDAKAVADFAATVSDSTDRATFKTELEAKIKTASASMKAAHEAVKKAVHALVDLAKSQKPKVETTTTIETEVQ